MQMNLLERILRKLKKAKNLKYGHQNHTRIEGGSVVKNFVGNKARKRFKAEEIALRKFHPYVPLPELLSADTDVLEIRTQLIKGINGADVSARRMAKVQFESGVLLKKIHSIPLEIVEGEIEFSGTTILHGDYTIRNLIVSESDHSILAILDWEKFRIGDPMRDIYWYEWVLRRSCKVTLEQLNSFFQGYGIETPEWEVRQSGILKLLDAAIEEAKAREDSTGIRYWEEQHAATKQLRELT